VLVLFLVKEPPELKELLVLKEARATLVLQVNEVQLDLLAPRELQVRMVKRVLLVPLVPLVRMVKPELMELSALPEPQVRAGAVRLV
jgi:hypothetical protein